MPTPVVVDLTHDDTVRILDFSRRCEQVHAGHKSSRPLSRNYEAIGKAGEVALGRLKGWPVNWDILPGGDDRVDFKTRLTTIDIKTARKPYNLLREVGVDHASVHVLAGYSWVDCHRVTIYGWETDETMVRQPSKDFGYGIVNHYRRRERLRDIDLLT